MVKVTCMSNGVLEYATGFKFACAGSMQVTVLVSVNIVVTAGYCAAIAASEGSFAVVRVVGPAGYPLPRAGKGPPTA
jgi:hypothetical protein